MPRCYMFERTQVKLQGIIGYDQQGRYVLGSRGEAILRDLQPFRPCVRNTAPILAFHNRIVVSPEPEMMCCPSEEITTGGTTSGCPLKSAHSMTKIIVSSKPGAIQFASGASMSCPCLSMVTVGVQDIKRKKRSPKLVQHPNISYRYVGGAGRRRVAAAEVL
ncbi:hypothetical protein K503DRAFT_854840 [Rhizopogon vinicolor AM-OR11-026]|uniref:Uncharacterized protein n=1 Tax=Rhizopogon vinicolor AM-OR11-026 TaxID=1314800 RepID=A0A1B7N8J5_9AGAM|nr:hypothetical protein K503DRAFT_854840 [Rhizopogon vinicolor AM-OR11-026]